jgi:7,8-dihydroneopterin aldolase/epimerase/oxygenase
MIVVELEGLEIFGRHGAGEEERARGQAFLYDVRLEVSDAALSDRLEDTVDYVAVAEVVKEISDGREFHLLEALAAAVADAVRQRFPVDRVRVRVRKREVEPAGLPVAWTAATVERP